MSPLCWPHQYTTRTFKSVLEALPIGGIMPRNILEYPRKKKRKKKKKTKNDLEMFGYSRTFVVLRLWWVHVALPVLTLVVWWLLLPLVLRWSTWQGSQLSTGWVQRWTLCALRYVCATPLGVCPCEDIALWQAFGHQAYKRVGVVLQQG